MQSSSFKRASMMLKEFPDDLNKKEKYVNIFLDFNEIKSIPDSFISVNSANLNTLSLIGNELSELPESIHNLHNLSELYLSENKLKSLPQSLSNLNQLKILHITGNSVERLPSNIGNLCKLEQLISQENHLQELPPSFVKLLNLRVLDLGYNELCSLPDDFCHLKSLTSLDLSNNNLESLPNTFGELRRIESLDLSENTIKDLPSTFKSNNVIAKLFLDANQIELLPEWVSCMPLLEEFSARDNKFHNQALTDEFPINCQDNLRTLDLAGNYMNKLPKTFGCLKKLHHLHLGSVINELEVRDFQNGNRIYSLPDSFCDLQQLAELHLDENQIHELPHCFGNLQNLTWLNLCQNYLYELPDSFCKLKNLRYFVCTKNHLEALPYDFGLLCSLEEVKLDHNLIAELPESLKLLTKLHTLDLYDNKLPELPSVLFEIPSLKRVEIDENLFEIEFDAEELPQLTRSRHYAARDPSKANDWRGRNRNDPCKDLNIIQSPSADIVEENYGSILKTAISRGSSIWRRHTGPKYRDNCSTKESGFISTSKPLAIHNSLSKESSETESCHSSPQSCPVFKSDSFSSETIDDNWEPECWDEDSTDTPIPSAFRPTYPSVGPVPINWTQDVLHDSQTAGNGIFSPHAIAAQFDDAEELESECQPIEDGWSKLTLSEGYVNQKQLTNGIVDHCYVPSNAHADPIPSNRNRLKHCYIAVNQFEDAD